VVHLPLGLPDGSGDVLGAHPVEVKMKAARWFTLGRSG
jgi:hypothetical protein